MSALRFDGVCRAYTDGVNVLDGVSFEQTDEGYRVTVPLRVYEVARDDEIPPVGSLWGESHEADAYPPYRGSPYAVYNPFSAPPGSSRRFVALQISRAVRAVYGIAITPETIDERYLVTLEDGGVAPRGGALSLRDDFPSSTAHAGPMAPVLLAAYRASIREWVRQSIVWGSLVLLLGFVMVSSLATVFGGVEPWALRALVEIPTMRLGQSAIGTLAGWVVGLTAIVLGYALVDRGFGRMEIPTEPSRYTLLRPREA